MKRNGFCWPEVLMIIAIIAIIVALAWPVYKDRKKQKKMWEPDSNQMVVQFQDEKVFHYFNCVPNDETARITCKSDLINESHEAMSINEAEEAGLRRYSACVKRLRRFQNSHPACLTQPEKKE